MGRNAVVETIKRQYDDVYFIIKIMCPVDGYAKHCTGNLCSHNIILSYFLHMKYSPTRSVQICFSSTSWKSMFRYEHISDPKDMRTDLTITYNMHTYHMMRHLDLVPELLWTHDA